MARTRPAPTRSYDPLAPLGPRALRRQVTQDVRSQTVPLARELTRQINAAAAAGAANIAGVSGRLAGELQSQQGVQRDIYSRASGSLGALDTAQAAQLGTAGDALSGDLRARLQSAGAPTGLADSLAAAGRGAAGAGYARGSAQVGQLIQDQAGAESYAAKLPGLAQLAGLQGVGQRRAQAQKDITDQLGALNAKVPGLIAQELEAARGREFQKAVAQAGFGVDVAKLNAQTTQNQASNAIKVKSNRIRQEAITAANDRSGKTLAERAKEHNLTLAEQRRHDDQTYRAGQRKQTATDRRNRQRDRQPDAALSAKYGHIVDHNGRPILDKHGRKIKTKSGSNSSGSSVWTPSK